MNLISVKGIFGNRRPLVLASASPRRSELLHSAGLEFTVIPAENAEPEPLPGEAAMEYAIRSARAKALAVATLAPPEADILAADTVVVLGEGEAEEILGKPRDEADALDMLRRLAGRWHRVITGCCLLGPASAEGARPEENFAVTSGVLMAQWGEEALRAYAATGEPMDKAGAYAIQGQGAVLVREVRGSYTNVVGLPLAEVVEALLDWGGVFRGEY